MSIETISNKYFLGTKIPNVKILSSKIDEIINAVNAFAISLITNKVTITKGSVTQGTNITTAVTINAGAGVITTVALTTAGGATSGPFIVNNSYVTSTSVIQLTAEYASGKTGNPIVQTEGSPSAGSFKIKVGNGAPAATPLNDIVKIHFVVL
jgi:hypothetical protein